MRTYEVWRCAHCGHIVAKDLLQPEAPERCQRMLTRGKIEDRRYSDCQGAYFADQIVDLYESDWEPGEARRSEERAVRYSGGLVG